MKRGFVIISTGLDHGLPESRILVFCSHWARCWCVLHRSNEAMLICQLGCFRDGAVAGAYRGISLYLLNCLVAQLILSKTVVSGFRTLFCINRPVLSEVFLRSAASTAQTDRHYAFKGEATVNVVLHCDTHVSLENTAANQNILHTQSHWNIMFDMVLQTQPWETYH